MKNFLQVFLRHLLSNLLRDGGFGVWRDRLGFDRLGVGRDLLNLFSQIVAARGERAIVLEKLR